MRRHFQTLMALMTLLTILPPKEERYYNRCLIMFYMQLIHSFFLMPAGLIYILGARALSKRCWQGCHWVEKDAHRHAYTGCTHPTGEAVSSSWWPSEHRIVQLSCMLCYFYTQHHLNSMNIKSSLSCVHAFCVHTLRCIPCILFTVYFFIIMLCCW